MNILCVGDPHIQEKYIDRSREMVEAVIKLVVDRKPDLVVVLGDTLHTFERVNTTSMDLAIEMLYRLSDLTTTALLIGNHDYPHPDVFMDAVHPFTSLRRSNIILGEKVINKLFGDIQLTFIPYVATGRFIEALNTNPGWRDSKIIFSHQEFKGCKMGSIISTGGDDWSEQDVQVVSGHIHDHQILKGIIYTGSPISHTYGESSVKTVSMISINENGKITEERILLGVRKMRLDRIKATDLIKYKIPDNSMLKVIVRGTISENNTAKKLDIVKEIRDMGHKIVFKDYKEQPQQLDESANKSYKYGDVLKEEIDNNPDLVDVYNLVFQKKKKKRFVKR